MADPNDDLLEDGDLADGHFELDLDEDALLADDYDEKPMKSLRSADCGRIHLSMEDEDFIEIGVDEDLALADEAKNEGDSGRSVRKTIVFDDSNNDDSDDGGKERIRFKTERNINLVPRPTSAIPETLDAVALKTQPSSVYQNRGRGNPAMRRGFRGGMRGPFQRGGPGFPPRFPRPPHPHLNHSHFGGPVHPMHLHHKHHSMDMGQPPHYQQNFNQMGADVYLNISEDCYQAPPTVPQPSAYQQPPVATQPLSTNIHVNPHFRGPRPQVNHNMSMWNGSGGYQSSGGQNPHSSNYHPGQHSQYQNTHHYQPPSTQSSQSQHQWVEGGNDYYSGQNASASANNYHQDEPYYNGMNSGSDQYYHHQQPAASHNQNSYQHTQQPSSLGGAAQMPWNDNSNNNYYSGHQGPQPLVAQGQGPPHINVYNAQMNAPMQQQVPYRAQNPHQNQPPHLQHLQHRKPPPFMINKKLPLFKNNKFQTVVKGRGGKIMFNNMKKETILQNKVSPTKPARVETGALRKIQITNLQEVPVVSSNVTTTCVPAVKQNIPEPEEEDEEMKAYRKKIEEQKKLREQVLKQKEEKRKVAAQQKFQMLAEQGVVTGTSPQQPNTSNPVQFKIVRVRLQDGRTVMKKLSPAQISKLKKISSATAKPPAPQVKNETPKSRMVVVDNLSASTTQKELEIMAKQTGKVERVKLNAEMKRATVVFADTASAAAFVQKFQRKMVDLSMISLRMVMNDEEGICGNKSSNQQQQQPPPPTPPKQQQQQPGNNVARGISNAQQLINRQQVAK